MSPTQLHEAADRRRRELAAIHCRKKELGLDRETYEAMLWTVARVRSAADLDGPGRRAVLDHMKARGGRQIRQTESRDRGPMLRKISAMLTASGRSAEYGDGIAKRMFKIERVEWCNPKQLRAIVAALSYDKRRADAKRPA